ncbi:Uncharacterised protein [Ralstonia pickettii]|nr:Uncharacterised protein [Ralstonia pickettii]
MPAAFSNGSVLSKMRPLDNASVSWLEADWNAFMAGLPLDAADLGADGGQLVFDAVVTAIKMIDAVDQRLALRDQPGDDEAGRGAGRLP